MITYSFIKRFSIYIILTFVIFTIIGTLSHELGHVAVAKFLGYKTYLSYGSMYHVDFEYEKDEDVIELEKLNNTYLEKGILKPEDLDTELLKNYNSLIDRIDKKFPENRFHSLLVTIGGPAQTLLTCFFGLFILWYRKTKKRTKFKVLDWLGIFLSLFILREIFNTTMAVINTLLFGSTQFHGDEFRISRLLDLNQWVIPIITMITGLAIVFYVIIKIIPLRYRFSFIVSGFIGGVLGYSIWFGFLGLWLFPTPISF